MSDEVTQEVETEVESVEQETETQEQPEAAEPAPFRAWELKPKETVTKHVPYDRFSEVIKERDTLAEELRKARETAPAPAAKATSSDLQRPKLEDFEDPSDYIDALTDYKVAVKLAERDERAKQEREQEAHDKAFAPKKEAYERNLAESFKRNPEYEQAARVIDKYSEYIHPLVARALVDDPNPAELMHKIATNQDLFNEMFSGDPIEFSWKLKGISAKIVRDEAQAEFEPAPRAKEAVRATIPTPVRPIPGKPTRDPAKMTTEEYRKFVANGYK
jgi:hypothetical protein